MTEISYASIESLVASSVVQGTTVQVQFRCPETGVEVQSTARIQKLDDVRSEASRSVKKNLFSGLRRTATRAVSDTLGKGMAGKIAKDLTASSLRRAQKNAVFGKREIQAGIVAAFEGARQSFRWDDAREAWTGATGSAATPTA